MKHNNCAVLLSALAMLTPDELDNKGSSGDTILLDKYPYSEDMVIPEIAGGWKLSYMGPKKVGEHGQIILFPNHPWANGLWIKGQMSVGMAAGLSEAHAAIWVKSRIRHKHKFLNSLAAALASEKKIQAYMEYRTSFSDDEYQRWSAHNSISDHLKPMVRQCLVDLIKECLAPPVEESKKKSKRKKPKVVE